VSIGCSVATQIGFAVTPAQPQPVEDLPAQVQEILSDEKLRQEIAEKVDAMEWTLN
jgi:hypothetical protein